MRAEVTSVDELRKMVGQPTTTGTTKVRRFLSAADKQWLDHTSLCFLATADGRGGVDVSPKGDASGFVRVIDDQTIAMPDRPGNRRLDGYCNILQHPYVATIFLIPGREDCLRINGKAQIVSDAYYFGDMSVDAQTPILALEIAIEEVFFHGTRALREGRVWNYAGWNPTADPSVAEIVALQPDS